MTLDAMLERVELGSCGLLERGMNGVRRGKGARTTVPAKDGRRARNLLDRDFTAPAPNPLGRGLDLLQDVGRFVYVTFVVDVFAPSSCSRPSDPRHQRRHRRTPLRPDPRSQPLTTSPPEPEGTQLQTLPLDHQPTPGSRGTGGRLAGMTGRGNRAVSPNSPRATARMAAARRSGRSVRGSRSGPSSRARTA